MQETLFEETIKRENNNKGITLIALVVTIIVLLILAGVSIMTLTGDNGIITRAAGAKTAVENASIREQVQLAVMAGMSNRDLSVDEEKLEEALGNSFGEKGTGYTIQGNKTEGWTITIPQNKSSYFVNSDGEFEEIEYEEPIDNSKSLVEGFVDDLGTRATIYLYGNSQKQVSKSITTTVTGKPDGSIVENYKNQPKIVTPRYTTELTAEANYVAYTVNKNGTYTFSVTDGNTTTETKIKVRNIETFTAIETLAREEHLSYAGNDTKAYTYRGAAVPKGYYVNTRSDVSTGLVITDEIDSNGYSTGNEWVWVPVDTDPTGTDRKFYVVGSGNVKGADTVTEQSPAVTYSKYGKLYSFTGNTRETYGTFHPYGTSIGTLGTPAGTSGYREPSLLTDDTYGDNANITLIAKRDGTGNFSDGDIKAVATQYVTDYNNMITSVETYNGFYIGRYELAKVSQGSSYVAKVQPGTSYINENWFSLYNKCLNLNKTGTATETSMMYGSLWDATMQWLSSNYNVGYTGNTYSGYGNYKTEAVTVSNNTTTITVKGNNTLKKLTTGQTSYTRSNNIYDLSGNCWDWTQEAVDSNIRVLRGGSYFDVYSDVAYSASRFVSDPTSSSDLFSSRPQLYIK